MKIGSNTSLNDGVVVGAIFICIALLFGIQAIGYPLGTPLRMGPGFIPLLLSSLLLILSVVIIVVSIREDDGTRTEKAPVPWKGIALVIGALIIFGGFGTRLGLVPVVFICSFTIALASAHNHLKDALLIGVAISALCWAVFKVGLGVTMPSFGSLLVF